MRIYDSYDEFLADSTARAVYLYDCDDNRVLYAVNEHDPRPVASITKIATALHVLECVSNPADTMIGMTQSSADEARRLEGYCAGFQHWVGTRFSVMDYLYGLLVASGCEAGALLADHVSGGNRTAFLDAINALAAREGCQSTRFCDPCGLLDEGRSTACDVFLLFRRMLENPILRRITATVSWVVPHLALPIVQTNGLKQFFAPCFFPYAVFSKTGTTDLAGKCLACSFERRGKTYIAVVLGADWEAARFYDPIASLICTAFAREGQFMRVTVDDHDVNASVGDAFLLRPRAVFNNTGEEPRFRFASLDPEVAAMDAHGVVTVRRKGIA